MLRATNDGVTALIDHDGKVLGRLPQFEPSVLTGRVQPREGVTPYVRVGNWPIVLVSCLALAMAAWRWRRTVHGGSVPGRHT